MKIKLHLVLPCVAVLTLALPFTASARAKKSDAASPSPSPAAAAAASPAANPARPIPYHGMISAVDTRAKTFTIAGKEKSRVFKVTDRSMLMKAGVAATFKDVAQNEEVRGSYWKDADGSLEAKSVKLGPMTDAEKAEAAKKSAHKKKKESAESSASPAASPAKQ